MCTKGEALVSHYPSAIPENFTRSDLTRAAAAGRGGYPYFAALAKSGLSGKAGAKPAERFNSGKP